MTMQIPDKLLWQDKMYKIADIKNAEALIDFSKLDLIPFSRATNCWRGHFLNYM